MLRFLHKTDGNIDQVVCLTPHMVACQRINKNDKSFYFYAFS